MSGKKSDYLQVHLTQLTLGHGFDRSEASRLFDRLYVGIFFNHEKRSYFTSSKGAIVTKHYGSFAM